MSNSLTSILGSSFSTIVITTSSGSESNSPSWDHDPNNLIDVTLRIDNSPIIGLQKSLTNKVVKLRREMWENISGSNNTINTRIGGNHYFDRFSGPWPSITPDGQKVKM